MSQAPALSPRILLSGVNTPVCALYLVTGSSFLLGKDSRCDAVLYFSSEISRQHARITWAGGQYSIEDLNSTNHTYLNGALLSPGAAYPLTPGDTVTLSSFTFLVEQLAL